VPAAIFRFAAALNPLEIKFMVFKSSLGFMVFIGLNWADRKRFHREGLP
jgi:hypothetical protein